MADKLTASNIIHAIDSLPKNIAYNYINPKTSTKVEVTHVQKPDGPIKIIRYDPKKGGTKQTAKETSISREMIWRVANAVAKELPLNFDRTLGASYNTRSALEALLAHTPEFYFAFPGRIESIRSSTKIKEGHKHLIWCPDSPHEAGIIQKKDVDVVISEIPSIDAVYEALVVPDIQGANTPKVDVDIKRRHAQIQIAIMLIGKQLSSRIWIANNDKGIVYNDCKIGEMDGVIDTLSNVPQINAHANAIKAANLIDCIWFRNTLFMPAVFEVEHSTGVTSGLSRMKNFKDSIPPIETRWVISAPDEDRDKVIKEANKEQFKDMNTKFFPYSSVEELYSLCQRRKIKGVTDKFLDCFMEPCLDN